MYYEMEIEYPRNDNNQKYGKQHQEDKQKKCPEDKQKRCPEDEQKRYPEDKQKRYPDKYCTDYCTNDYTPKNTQTVEIQTHTHEFLGSTKLAEEEEDRHNHRFAGVTSEEIPVGKGRHIHSLQTNTDFFENHHHEIGIRTGLDIDVGKGKHVHFAHGTTTLNDGHFHQFQFATLIDSPLTPVED